MRRLVAPALVIASTALVAAQDYRVEVRLVEVEVRVVDHVGRPVPDLGRADFTLAEDGVPHDIATVQFVPPAGEWAGQWHPIESPPAGGAAAPPPAPPTTPTWVYVASEVGPTDVLRTHEALRTFVLNDLQPGFHVSIAGEPFSDNRAQLLSTLARVLHNPYGPHGLVDGEHSLADDAAADRALSDAFRRQEEGVVPLMGFTARPERIETSTGTAAQAQPYLTSGRVDRQMPVYGAVALSQYFDLVERLAELPGKKVIVLFRPGLRLETDNVGLLHDLASYAARRRVSFYTVDSRGLSAPPPVDDKPVPFMIDRRRRVGEPDLIGQLESQSMAREGLDALARETGGKAFLASNRLADVFDQVSRDASGFYVLSYYPIDLTSAGRFRRVKVRVSKPGLKVQQVMRGYYEPRAESLFQKNDRGLALRRAMQASAPPSELPVAASLNYFASAGGTPVLVLSAGVPASQLEPAGGSHERALSATAMVRVADAAHDRLPMYFERMLQAPIPPGEWSRVKADRTAFVSMSDVLALPSGEYEWRVVFRDNETGRLGGLEGHVTLDDFRGPSAPSSLLLTRAVTRADDSAPAGDGVHPLDAGALRYEPQPSLVFRQGEPVHLLFALYNATATDFESAEHGMKLALLRGGQPVGRVDAYGGAVADRAHGLIRFAGLIRTDELEPGTYVVQALLPDFQHRRVRHVEQRFVLLARKPS